MLILAPTIISRQVYVMLECVNIIICIQTLKKIITKPPEINNLLFLMGLIRIILHI